MPLGGGRLVLALVATSSFALSNGCAGRSMDPGEAPAGAGGTAAASGGTGGRGAGTGGLTITGGSAGTGSGGTMPMAGAGGSGGIAVIELGCPDCPAASYGLVVHGDGADYRMQQTKEDSDVRDCPAEPLRGSRAGCSGTFLYLSACQDLAEESGCLRLYGKTATYTDRAGTVWTGMQTRLTSGAAPARADAGTITLELTSGANQLDLTVDFVFCNDATFVRIVCD